MSEQRHSGEEVVTSVLPKETRSQISSLFGSVIAHEGMDVFQHEMTLLIQEAVKHVAAPAASAQRPPVVESPPAAESASQTVEEPPETTVTVLPSNAFLLPEVPCYTAKAGEFLPFRIRLDDPEYLWPNTHEGTGVLQFEPGVRMTLTPMLEDTTSMFIGTEPTIHELLEDPISIMNMQTMRPHKREDVVEEDATRVIHTLLLRNGHNPEDEKVKTQVERQKGNFVTTISAYDSQLVLTTEPHDPTSTDFATMYSSTEADSLTEQFITIERAGPAGKERNRPFYDIEPSQREGTLNVGRIILQGEIALIGVPAPPVQHLLFNLPGAKKHTLQIETYAELIQEGAEDYPEALVLMELAAERLQLREPEPEKTTQEQTARPANRQQTRTTRGERRHIGRPTDKQSQGGKDKPAEDKKPSTAKTAASSTPADEPAIHDPLEGMFGEDPRFTIKYDSLDRKGQRIARKK